METSDMSNPQNSEYVPTKPDKTSSAAPDRFLPWYFRDTLNEVDVYSSTGTASPTKYDTDAGQVYDQHVGIVPGVHSYEEYLKNPGLYSSPREVRVGCSLSF